MTSSPQGPWICCPWCEAEIPLSLFAPSDEEPDAVVAVCRGCLRRVLLSDGALAALLAGLARPTHGPPWPA